MYTRILYDCLGKSITLGFGKRDIIDIFIYYPYVVCDKNLIITILLKNIAIIVFDDS